MTSAIAMIGRNLKNNKNMVKNRPNVPRNCRISTQVGSKYPQLAGRKSRCNEMTTITNRSNHIPMFTKIVTIHMRIVLVRNVFDQNNCGEITLHRNIVQ